MTQATPLPYWPQVEIIPPDEERDIAEIVAVMRDLLVRDEEACGQRRRDVHVKSHGCPLAQLQVLPNLPDELRQGLFEHEHTYPAAVRFSNTSPLPKPDALPDGRGVAIKVQEVAGLFTQGSTDPAVQDFVLADHPTFLARNVKDYLRMMRARGEGLRKPQLTIKALTSGSLDPRRWHWLEAAAAARALSRFPLHPVQLTYWSMAPFRYGDYTAKFRLRPSPTNEVPRTRLVAHRDAFRLALAEILQSTSLTFEFQVQLRTNAWTMPIEDATVRWPEEESPYQTVALLVIPQQDIEASPFGNGDHLTFNPWNALEAHRPLGGVNRSRKASYQLSTQWRHPATAQPAPHPEL